MKLNITPEPNFEQLRRALLRKEMPDRVPHLELFADVEIIQAVLDRIGYPPLPAGESDEQSWIRQRIHFWHQLGYDSVWMNPGPRLKFAQVSAEDTAALPHEQRNWHLAQTGIIQSWEDYDRYPWPSAEDADFSLIEFATRIMPEGMKIFINVGGMLEPLMWLMAYEPFAIALYENPDLIEAMVAKITDIFTPVAETALEMDSVGGLFTGDDMGFKTATMISPDHLRKYIFPYHKRLAAMTHKHDKIYILHACGQLETVMEDLIRDVKIDAKHSYEDAITPVEEIKARYGDRIGIVGGIDVDFLCRATEEEVRARVREVLDVCMVGGGYALGTGNSVANYIPINNFLAMVDEGHKWRP